MTRTRNIFIVLMALVMLFAITGTALAGSGERDVTTAENGGLAIVMTNGPTFETKAVWVNNPDTSQNYESFASYGSLPSGTDLSSVPVAITYRGTQLLVDGVLEHSGANGLHTNVSVNLDLDGRVCEVVVKSSAPDRTYFVAGLISGSTFSATVKVNYDTAIEFAALDPGDTYPGLQTATAAQIATANTAIDTVDYYFSSGHSELFTALPEGINTIEALHEFAGEVSYPGDPCVVSGSSTYVSAIGDGVTQYGLPHPWHNLAENSCGTLVYQGYTYPGGGWMYKVERGGADGVFPTIGGSQWRVLPGDIITWIYTCNWGEDIDNPMI